MTNATNTTNLILHYAPDNASLCIRLALEATGQPYSTRLVDRSARAQRSAPYLALNPNGLIPVLETPDGALFETAAILLWLAERHPALLPADRPARATAMTWLIWMANTLHPTLRMLFYPEQYIGATGSTGQSGQALQAALHSRTTDRLNDQLRILNDAAERGDWIGGQAFGALECYLCPMLRWSVLYPLDAPARPRLADFPALQRIARHCETLPASLAAQRAEGLGPTPFSAPSYPQPPEGSAT